MTDELLVPIPEMAEQVETILTQDNACTSWPIYVVQEKIRIDGMDPEYAEEATWRQPEAEYLEASEREAKLLDEIEDKGWNDYMLEHLPSQDIPRFTDDDGLLLLPSEWELCYYVEKWVDRQWFFTEVAAEAHMRQMAHNYNDTRIFVDSLYRNHHMQMVQTLLRRIAGLNDYDAYAVEQHLSGVSSSNMVHRAYHEQKMWELQSEIDSQAEDIKALIQRGDADD